MMSFRYVALESVLTAMITFSAVGSWKSDSVSGNTLLGYPHCWWTYTRAGQYPWPWLW